MSQVPVVPPMKSSAIEARAQDIVKRLYPDALRGKKPVPVDHFFECIIPDMMGVRTSYMDLGASGIMNAEGYTNASERVSIVDRRLLDESSPRGRRRFRATVGHEAGHCVLHVPLTHWQASLLLVGRGMKRERASLRAFEDPEWQAWRFCHGLCMPAPLVSHLADKYGTGPSGIDAIQETCDVNRSFVMARLRMLKLIPADRTSTGGKKFARNSR